MARVQGQEAAAVYAVAERFVDRALRRSGSVFSSRRRWTPDLLDELAGRLDGQLRAGAAGTFGERWGVILHGAGDEIIELAAEVLAVHLLVPTEVSGTRKQWLVETTLARSASPPRIPPVVYEALGGGLAGCGVAYTRRRLSQLRLLVDGARAWKQSPAAQRRAALADADAFKGWLAGVAHDGAHSQQEALLHLVHPDAFEAITSRRVKRAVAERYAQHDGGEKDVDRRLAHIRAALEQEHGPGFAFVDLPPVQAALAGG